jgi:uncharacterized protein
LKRYLDEEIKTDLEKKMVILGGPRQVGKTTCALAQISTTANEGHLGYLNWDHIEDRNLLLSGQLPGGQKLIIFDEIHKYSEWRNLVKGFYDKNKSKTKFMVTGSARLDFYRRGGDSLIGRYNFYRLHPLSLFEINKKPTPADLEALLEFGGFPEMFLTKDKKEWKKWQRTRVSRVIKDDLLSLEQVKEVSQIELLSSMLIEKVGSLLSINSIREDLKCSHEAASRWIAILENVYYCFRIAPFYGTKFKALKKDQKLYLWDWSTVKNDGAKFENLLASNLLKYCHYHEDVNGDALELRYLRDRDKREIDFVIIKNGTPLFAVECKTGEKSLSKHIPYFAARTDIPVFYQVHMGNKWTEIDEHRAQIIGMRRFASEVLQC